MHPPYWFLRRHIAASFDATFFLREKVFSLLRSLRFQKSIHQEKHTRNPKMVKIHASLSTPLLPMDPRDNHAQARRSPLLLCKPAWNKKPKSSVIKRVLGTRNQETEWKIEDATGTIRYIKASTAKTYIYRMSLAGIPEPEYDLEHVGTRFFIKGIIYRRCRFRGFKKPEFVKLSELPPEYHLSPTGKPLVPPTRCGRGCGRVFSSK